MAQGRFALERLSLHHLELAFPWLRGLCVFFGGCKYFEVQIFDEAQLSSLKLDAQFHRKSTCCPFYFKTF